MKNRIIQGLDVRKLDLVARVVSILGGNYLKYNCIRFSVIC